MEVRLCSGIRVSIQENGDSKLLFFDRPVKGMELSQKESAQLGAILLKREGNSGITAELRNLINTGFFNCPRNFSTIKNTLVEKEINVTATSLNRILSKLVEREELLREGQRGAYVYRDKPIEANKGAVSNA